MRKFMVALGGRLLLLALLLAVAAAGGLALVLLLGAGQKIGGELAALRPAADTRPVPAAATDTKPVVTQRAATAVRLLEYGAQPGWSARGDSIVFQRNVGGVMEIFISDTALADSRCLTVHGLVPAELRGKHKGNALLHPAGKLIIFTAENLRGDHGPGTLPESGFNHDVWAMTVDGQRYWRLAETAEQQAVAGLVLSPDGRRLLWSRQVGPPVNQPGAELGFWEIYTAELRLAAGAWRLAGARSLLPLGPGYYGTGSFLRDNRSFIFSAADSGASAYGADLYRYDARRRRPERLTATPLVFDGNARLSPDNELMAWTAGRPVNNGRDWQTELYVMRRRGAALAQLTHFNEPGHDEYLREPTEIGAPAWQPRGKELMASYRFRLGMLGWQQRLFILPVPALPEDTPPAMLRRPRAR